MDASRPTIHKRTRSTSSASTSSTQSADTEDDRLTKSLRPQPGTSSAYTCSLPPSCDVTPTSHATAAALDSHNQLFHSHLCHAPKLQPAPPRPPTLHSTSSSTSVPSSAHPSSPAPCHRVFPSAHLLSLHLSELHSPLNPLLPTPYACLDPSCLHRFESLKGRRLHAIEKHGFPKQWFFGVVVWGVEGVLAKGGGMVRREWKARTVGSAADVNEGGDELSRADGGDTRPRDGSKRVEGPVPVESNQGSMRTTAPALSDDEHEQRPWSPPDSPEHGWLSLVRPPESATAEPSPATTTASMDDLSSALEGVSLGLVPRSVLKARAKAKAKEQAMDVEGGAS